MLQHAAPHCNTLQHAATHCNTLQHAAPHCNTLHRTATRCNTLQHAATLARARDSEKEAELLWQACAVASEEEEEEAEEEEEEEEKPQTLRLSLRCVREVYVCGVFVCVSLSLSPYVNL